jgi:hypothetical protein
VQKSATTAERIEQVQETSLNTAGVTSHSALSDRDAAGNHSIFTPLTDTTSSFSFRNAAGTEILSINTVTDSETVNITGDLAVTGDFSAGNLNTILTPLVTNIEEGELVEPEFTVEVNGFLNLIALETHTSTDWYLYEGATLLESSVGDTTNLTSWTPSHQIDKSLTLNVRFNGSAGNTSELASRNFSTNPSRVDTPTIVSIGVENVDFEDGDIITSSAFSSMPTDGTHESSSWEIRKTSDDSLVASSYTDTTNLTSWTPDLSALDEDIEVKVRVKHISTEYGESAWSSYETFYFNKPYYLAIAHGSSPFSTVIKQDLDTFIPVDNPKISQQGRGTSFSPDGTYLAIAHYDGNFFSVFKRSGNNFIKLTTPSVDGIGLGCAFSADGTYLAIAHGNGNRFTVFKRSGDAFTALTTPSVSGTGRCCAFSPDDTYLAIGYVGGAQVFKRSGDTFTSLGVITIKDTYGIAFSSGGTYLACANASTKSADIFKRSGDTFNVLASPTLSGIGVSASFTADSTYLAIGTTSGNHIYMLKRSGDTFTTISGTPTVPFNGYGAAFSADGTHLAVSDSEYSQGSFGGGCTILKRDGDSFLPIGGFIDRSSYGCAFFPVAVPGSR